MAVTFVNWGTRATAGQNSNNANAGGNVTPVLPANIQEGDLIVLFCMNRNGTGATGFTATGYTEIANFGGSVRVALLAKRATAAETNPTVSTSGTAGANQPTIVLTGAWRGVDLSILRPRELGSNTRNLTTTTNTTGFNFPAAADPLLDGSLFLVVSAANNDYTTAPATGGGYTVLIYETTAGNDCSMVAAYQIQATAAAIGQGTFGGNTTGTAGSNVNSSIVETVKRAVPLSFAQVL